MTQFEGVVIADAPTSMRSRRTIELDPETIAVMRAHLARRREAAMECGWRSELVFPNPLTGEAWKPDSISQRFERTSRRIPGLPKIHFHDLRHGHASHLLELGENPRLVSDRLGNSTVAFTLDTYAHTRREEHVRAASAIAARLDASR
jgi:integrase